MIDWEIFRPILERMDKKEHKSRAGRKPSCRIIMFKMFGLQRLNALSDERLQYRSHRLPVVHTFLGVELRGNVPDEPTIWACPECVILFSHP
jgi:transposase, IS5 family